MAYNCSKIISGGIVGVELQQKNKGVRTRSYLKKCLAILRTVKKVNLQALL